jgi:hypothetical protein
MVIVRPAAAGGVYVPPGAIEPPTYIAVTLLSAVKLIVWAVLVKILTSMPASKELLRTKFTIPAP